VIVIYAQGRGAVTKEGKGKTCSLGGGAWQGIAHVWGRGGGGKKKKKKKNQERQKQKNINAARPIPLLASMKGNSELLHKEDIEVLLAREQWGWKVGGKKEESLN